MLKRTVRQQILFVRVRNSSPIISGHQCTSTRINHFLRPVWINQPFIR